MKFCQTNIAWRDGSSSKLQTALAGSGSPLRTHRISRQPMKSNCLPKIIIITLSANEIKLSLVRKFVPAFENWRSILLFRSLTCSEQDTQNLGLLAFGAPGWNTQTGVGVNLRPPPMPISPFPSSFEGSFIPAGRRRRGEGGGARFGLSHQSDLVSQPCSHRIEQPEISASPLGEIGDAAMGRGRARNGLI